MAGQTNWSEVEAIIRDAEVGDTKVGVALIAPNGDTFSHNGDRKFGAASTMKIPLMIEIFKEIERGERTLDDVYVLRNEDRAVGSGVMLHLSEETALKLNDLIYLMISISDNTATNVLIDMATFDRINATMQSLGMSNSNVGRKMKGRPAQGDEQENWATPNDYARVVKLILANEAASPESTEQIIEMLRKQQNTKRISRYLPESQDIRWGSKTGSVKGVCNDVGFITSPKGTLIVSVFVENPPDQHVGEKLIGDISRAAMKATGVVEPLYTS